MEYMIGIIGGYGNIGQWAATLLYENLQESIKIGGRSREKFDSFIKINKLPKAQYQYADIDDKKSIQEFASGCTSVLNCAGPTYDKSSGLGQIMRSMNIKYADVGYASKQQTDMENNQSNILCKAGAIPGLSGLLPRYLAMKFDKVFSMEFYYQALGRFTKTAAEDYLKGIFINTKGEMPRKRECETRLLPLSSTAVNLYPYYDGESDYVRRKLSLDTGQWFMALEGECTKNFMNRMGALLTGNKGKIIEELCNATYIDTLGRKDYAGFVIQMKGEKDGKQKVKTLLLKGDSPEYLTGAVAASAVIAMERMTINTETGELYSMDKVQEFMQILEKIGQGIQIHIENKSIEELLVTEEGEI